MSTKLSLIRGDLTKLDVDAIVNAANSSLLGGGGVDGAIHRAGGPEIAAECHKIRERQGGCPTGEAVITGSGNLPARYVIHTVGPVWQGGNKGESELLASCYRNSLRIALDNGICSIAFPNISTGIYGYPKEEACHIALATVADFLNAHAQLSEVIFVCFDSENFELYQKGIREYSRELSKQE